MSNIDENRGKNNEITSFKRAVLLDMVQIILLPSETFFSVLCPASGLPPPLLREYQFCPTSDTLPWVIEPDVESQSGDALLNAWHLVQIWKGLHYRYRLTSFPIPESPWGISSSVRGCVCFPRSALPPSSAAYVEVGPCVGIRVIRCWNMRPIIPLIHTVLIC